MTRKMRMSCIVLAAGVLGLVVTPAAQATASLGVAYAKPTPAVLVPVVAPAPANHMGCG